MTAQNLVVLGDCVHLVSDGQNGHNGAPHSAGHKVLPMPHIGCAVGVRGSRPAMGIAWELISGAARSFDHLREYVVEIIRPVFDAQRATLTKHFGADALRSCEIVVAGWSESRGPAGFVMTCDDAQAASGFPAWSPVDIEGAFFAPSAPELHQRFERIQLEWSDARAVELVDRQRKLTPDVGGFCQLTTVRETGIETRILTRWS